MAVEIPAELVDRLAAVERVVALTGAGISAESGVPTFRDAQTGLWAKYPAEELATPEAFLTALSGHADYVLRGPSGEILPQLVKRLRETKARKRG